MPEILSEHDCKHKGEKFLKMLPANAVVAEVGVLRGDFSEKILDLATPKKLHLIDCWEEQSKAAYNDGSNAPQPEQDKRYKQVCDRFKGIKEVEINRGYSTVVGPSFPDEYFDWIYLDANHAYKPVKEDLETFYPKIKKGGYISGHDYDPKWGVPQAVDEFVEEHEDIEFVYIIKWGKGSYIGNPSYILRKDK